MGKPTCVLGSQHVCPVVDPGPKPHVGGPVVSPGQSFVKYNGLPLAVEGGACLCTGMPGQDKLSRGSGTVKINGKGVMRLGDTTSHGGKMINGMPGLKMD